MKLGLLGDIHANLPALKACIQRLQEEGCDKIYTTGDVVGYGPYPLECIELLIDNKILSVKGNHDQYTIDRDPLWSINREARFAVEWTRRRLPKEYLIWLKKLPDLLEIEDCAIVHASNAKLPKWTYVIDENSAKANFTRQKHRICFNGHTHIPLKISFFPEKEPLIDFLSQGKIPNKGRHLINVGSVGQPRDGDPRATCVTFDTQTDMINIYRVPYDIDETQNQMIKYHFPKKLIQRLEIGR